MSLLVIPAFAQASDDEAPQKSVYIGLRVRALPTRDFSVMTGRSLLATTPASGASQAVDWNFATASHSPMLGFGGQIEIAPFRRWYVSVEGTLHRLSYTKVTQAAAGRDDPATTNDERIRTYVSEDTRGKLWDFPVLFHYRGMRSAGPLSKLYVAGGVAIRTVTGLKTTNLVTNSDSSTSTNNLLLPPSKRNLLGTVAGIGIRTIDDFHIHWTPEIRYTRWGGSTFGLESTVSPRDQLEISLGMSF